MHATDSRRQGHERPPRMHLVPTRRCTGILKIAIQSPPSDLPKWRALLSVMAGPTRLELATSGVTGRRSNQLNYDPAS